MAGSNPHACGFPDEPCSACEACVCDTDFTCLARTHQDVGPGDETRDSVAGADSKQLCQYCDESDDKYCAVHHDRRVQRPPRIGDSIRRTVDLHISERYRCCYKNGCGPNCW